MFAGSVLANSSRLGTDVLVEIASNKGQDHLLAISGRPNLPSAVTDVIVDRGEDQVIRKLANNAGAKFSDEGYSTSSPAPRGRRTGREFSACAAICRQSSWRPVAPRQGSGPRPPAGHRAARGPGRDQAGPERDRPRGAAPGRSFGVAEEYVKLMKGLNELDDAAVYNFAESKSSTRSRLRSRFSMRCRSKWWPG
jgi:hypothetical protein